MQITWGKIIAVVVIVFMVAGLRYLDTHGLDFLPSVSVK
jgi:hypothetical protein